MSIARWPGLLPGWWRGIDSVNGFADTFEAIGAVDSPNLAEEGLDRRSISANLHENVFEVQENTRYTLTTNTTSTGWALWDPSGANPLRYTTNFDVAADEVVVVRSRIVLTSLVGAVGAARWGLGNGTTLRTRLKWNDLSVNHFGGYARRSNAFYLGQVHGVLDGFLVIPGPVTVDYVQIEHVLFDTQADTPFSSAQAGCSPEHSLLLGTRYRRIR